MARVEPVPDAPAATATVDGERALLIADYHAGIEAGLRYERGVELDSAADRRRDRLCRLLARTDADRLVVLGDLAHRVSGTNRAERAEIDALLDALDDRDVACTLATGNHDTSVAEQFDRIDATDPGGRLLDTLGVVHGHTWPAPEVLAGDVVCVGHEHPAVKLADEVARGRKERAWLRGPLDREPFAERGDDTAWNDPELVVFPAFNDRSGGTWVNVERDFLAPFLPDALPDAQAYLLDGTRLGPYRRV